MPSQPIFLEIRWPRFAVGVVGELQARFVAAGACPEEWTDEFVVRQVLRECFARLAPGLSVQAKEEGYVGKSKGKRMDLKLGEWEDWTIAVEIKSDPDNLQGVESDWEKICNATQRFKLVIFAGVCPESDLAKFAARFPTTRKTLATGKVLHFVTEQSSTFGEKDKRVAAFLWLWYVDAPLPAGIEMKLVMEKPSRCKA